MDIDGELKALGLTDRWLALFSEIEEPGAALGRVITGDRGSVMVTLGSETVRADVRPNKTGPVAVGDWVAVTDVGIEHILDRLSLLTRTDPEGKPQPLVANVDFVLIVCAADRPRKTGRIERSISQAFDAGSSPVVVLTKSDLFDDVDAEISALQNALPLVDVYAVSSTQHTGLDELSKLVAGKTSVMLGESGAGKSTLLNALSGAEIMQTGDVRHGDNKGRHTTTRRELHVGPNDAVLIDTPGLRALALSADIESVDFTFADIAELTTECRFRDCAHESEPGCAVIAAAESGEISSDRVESWRALRKEAQAYELRRNEHERRQSERKFGRVVDEALRMKGKKP